MKKLLQNEGVRRWAWWASLIVLAGVVLYIVLIQVKMEPLPGSMF